MGKKILLHERVFGLLKVSREVDAGKIGTWWECQCQCGNVVVASTGKLRYGHIKSCGCLQKTRMKGILTRHGKTGTAEHNVWKGMIARCQNKNEKCYENYGGRGITVCDRWLGNNGFQNFLDDMGTRPDGMTIERIDNELGYSPNNCRWATRLEQGNNKRGNRKLEAFGKTQGLSQWAAEYGVLATTIHHRIKRGMTLELALTEPKSRGCIRVSDKCNTVQGTLEASS